MTLCENNLAYLLPFLQCHLYLETTQMPIKFHDSLKTKLFFVNWSLKDDKVNFNIFFIRLILPSAQNKRLFGEWWPSD